LTFHQRLALSHARFVYRFAPWILLGAVVLIALCFPFASQLRLKANLIDLLPGDMPSVQRLNELTALVGGTSFLIAVIESEDEDTARDATRLFAEKIATFPEVDHVDNRTDMGAFQNRRLLFLTLESLKEVGDYVHDLIGYHRRTNNPFYIDLLEEEEPKLDIESLELEERVHKIGGFAGKESDSFMRVILIKPAHPVSDLESTGRLNDAAIAAFQEIQQSFEHPMTLGFTGPYKTRYDEYHVIIEDLARTGILTVLIIIILMVAFFRNIRSTVYAFLSLGVGIFWTCAFTQVTIGYLNLITAFLLGILFGLGIGFAIHILARFAEERKTESDMLRALEKTFEAIGEPSLTSALTSSIAFFSLTISHFYGFKHFGLIAGVGIMLCFLSIFLILPSLLVISDRFLLHRKLSHFSLKESWGKVRRGPIYGVLVAGLLFSIFSMIQISKADFEYDFANLQQEGAESIVFGDRIGKHFGVVLNPVGLVTADKASAFELARRISRYIEENPDTSFHFAASIMSHIPRNQKDKIELMRDMDALLEERQELINSLDAEDRRRVEDLRKQLAATPLTIEDIPKDLRKQYEGKEGKVSVVYVYPVSSLLDGQMAKRFVRELRSFDLPPDVTLAGEPVIYADILILLERDTPLAMMISLGLVVLLLFIHFRRPSHVLWVLSPIVVGFLWLMGMTSLAGFKFNYLNVTILPSILGVGIDSGIHIFHRYKKEKRQTLFEILKKTGLAVVLTSLTTMAAFGSLFLARHRGMSSLGELGFLGFVSCLLASVIFIPAFIEFLEMKHWHIFRTPRRPKVSS